MVLDERTVDRRRARARLTVHLGLIVTAAVSLTLEPVLTLHIALGLVFIGLVGAHLVQRRHTTSRLASRLVHPVLTRPSDRLALSDALLLALTVAMFGSGLWDWLAGRPTRIRWHALTGVALSGYLVVHTVRRRRRLGSSRVR